MNLRFRVPPFRRNALVGALESDPAGELARDIFPQAREKRGIVRLVRPGDLRKVMLRRSDCRVPVRARIVRHEAREHVGPAPRIGRDRERVTVPLVGASALVQSRERFQRGAFACVACLCHRLAIAIDRSDRRAVSGDAPSRILHFRHLGFHRLSLSIRWTVAPSR